MERKLKKDRQRFRDVEAGELSGQGTIYSLTTVTDPPLGFGGEGYYKIALIHLKEGHLMIAQLTDEDPETFEIGDEVEAVTRRLRDNSEESGIISYGTKFRPLIKRSI